MKCSGPTYRVVFQAAPDKVAPVLRLRALLNRGWRAFRFRALKVEENRGGEWGRPDATAGLDFRDGEGI